MPFDRPTLATLKSRAISDLDSRLPGSDARLRRSNTNVLATVLAGLAHGQYGYLDFLARQILPDTAESEYLDRHASLWGIDRKAASAASGSITVTGTSGTVVPALTIWRRSDGAEYSCTVDCALADGTASIAVTASVAGADGDTDAGSTLTLVNTISGVYAAATVADGGLSGGSDEESDASLLARLLARIQEPPHGGADFDYIAWALQVAGVTRAWCYPAYLGLGTVGVTFVCDDADDIIPAAGLVTEVRDYIDALRPVTAQVTVFAPEAVPLDPRISVTPNTSAVRAAVTAQLEDLISREAEPGGTIYLSHIREAISLADGEMNHIVSSPTGDVVRMAGQITTLGTITWL